MPYTSLPLEDRNVIAGPTLTSTTGNRQLPTRRALRDLERGRVRNAQIVRQRPEPRESRHEGAKASLRNRVLGCAAMTVVAVMAVATSTPAVAASAVAAEPTHADDRAGAAQAIEVGPATVTAKIKRDGYTVEEAPEPVVSAGTGATSAVGSGESGDGAWAAPVSGTITDPFGSRPERPVAGVSGFHKATDIAAGCGEPVSAASGGTVIAAGWEGSYGNWVLIDHGNGIQTGYAHNSALLVSVGQTVSTGETIARVGTTGASTGCHVHFETRVDGVPTDPQAFMSERGVTIG